jgi:hypothetical protein
LDPEHQLSAQEDSGDRQEPHGQRAGPDGFVVMRDLPGGKREAEEKAAAAYPAAGS